LKEWARHAWLAQEVTVAGMEASIEIARPPEAVFAFFADLERNVLATDTSVQSIAKNTEGPIGPGTTYVMRQPVLGRVREQQVRVNAVDPNRRIDMEARFGPVAPIFTLEFEPTARGTRVTFRGDSRPVGPLKLLTSLADRIGERNWVRRLHLIKTVLEAEEIAPS
jgi:uncharacterized protein YndB with AHSA1/START domain